MKFMCIHWSVIPSSQLHFPANNNTELACVASKLQTNRSPLSALRIYVMDTSCVNLSNIYRSNFFHDKFI